MPFMIFFWRNDHNDKTLWIEVTFTYSLKSFPLQFSYFSEIQFGKAIALLQCPILSNWMALFSKGLEKVIKRLSFLALKATLWPDLPNVVQKIFNFFKVEKILKGSLDSISSPSSSVKIQTFENKKFVDITSNVLPYYLK